MIYLFALNEEQPLKNSIIIYYKDLNLKFFFYLNPLFRDHIRPDQK